MEPETKWDLTNPPEKINITWKYADQFYDNLEKQKENKMNELYEIKIGTETAYGYKLAMNSENKLVMEIKGNGNIVVVNPDDVKEIMPYTISVTSFSGDAARSYTIESGKVAVNDIVLHTPKGSKTVGLGIVTALDTKVKGAAQFTGSKLVAEHIV